MSKNILDNLNKEQQEAVLYNDGPLAIIAGAGTGKTRTIAHKVAYLIIEKNLDPNKILAVSFTNKASNELKERIISLVGPKGNFVNVFTYHSFCSKILREEIDYFDYPKRFTILDNIDQKQILKPGYAKLKISSKTISFSSVIDYISQNKMKGVSPEEALKNAEKESDIAIAKLYKHYQKSIIRSKSLDFDDLLLFTERLFKAKKNIAKKWGEKFDFILVDEFQDTSINQYNIITAIASHKKITVVGDPDQTIYTWRHADPKLIINFTKKFKDSQTVVLEENYRSTPQILDAANMLINCNHNRTKKSLFTKKPDGHNIEYNYARSEDSEAQWVISKIKDLRKQKNQLKDIAILFRANYLSMSLEKALIKENINYVIFGGTRFYQREEIKDAIAFLKIIQSGEEVSMKRMLNKPSRKIGGTAREKLESLANAKRKTLFNTIVDHWNEILISNQALENLAAYINLINKYKAALKSNPIYTVLEKFLIEVKYMDMWPKIEDNSRIENIKELILSIKEWEIKNKDKKLNDFLDEISLFIERDSSFNAKDFVSLMTVHTAKGLEYENVFIFGFSEEVFPSKRSINERGQDALEEERRLAYVATTRAKSRLFISSSRGWSIDHTFQKKPSRFIKELGINIRDFTSEFIAPKEESENYHEKVGLNKGDKVFHDKFGEGVVLKITDDIAEIAFRDPYGVKSMMKKHKSIVKVKN